MHINEKYNWLKHLDFMIIDVIILVFSFTLGYLFTFNTIAWWKVNEWVALAFFICIIDLLITFIINPYSGIFRKSFTENIINFLLLAVYNFAIDCFVFYVLKIGELFSRGTLLVTYTIYFILGLIIKNLWKKVLETGKLQNKIPLYVVCEEGKQEEVFHNCLADDVQRYDIVGSSYSNDFIKDLLSKNAREILISIKPGLISKETYEQLMANGIGIHMDIESMVGFQTEDQQVTRVGVYKTLSVGTYSFTPKQLFYLSIKRLFDVVCGLIGLIVLIPLSIIIKVVYLCNGDTKSYFIGKIVLGNMVNK